MDELLNPEMMNLMAAKTISTVERKSRRDLQLSKMKIQDIGLDHSLQKATLPTSSKTKGLHLTQMF